MLGTQIKMSENDIVTEDVPAFNRLLRQLNPESPVARFKSINVIMLRSDTIVTLRDMDRGGALIGIGMLIATSKLFYTYGNVEEVVVDENYRRRGLARALMTHIMNKGRALGMRYLFLSSHSSREEANELYKSMGFEEPDTNFYRLYY